MFETLSSLALESVLFGLLVGTALTFAVATAVRLFGSVNAATRAVVWSLALCALPIIPAIYFFSHLPSPAPPPMKQVIRATVVPQSPLSTITVPNMPAARQTTAPRPIHVELPEHLPEAALAFYILVAQVLLFRLLISYFRLRLLRRRTQPAPPELTSRLQYWLTRCPTLRPVELRLSARARSPLAVGFFKPLIVMPTDLVLELSAEEYDDLGVHELAHLHRYDDWTNLAQRILHAFLFFHPAAWYIGRQLKLEREIACDDWVAAAHESKSYARCLTKVIELQRYQRGALLLSSGAFFGKRQIVKRVESLLDKTRNSATGTSTVTIICVILALFAIATQLVHLPAVVAFTQDEAGANTSSRWVDDSHDLRIKIRGDVTFSDDDQSIASVSPDGFFIVDEAKGWSHRRLEVRNSSEGTPQLKYFLDGREKPLDGVGKAWAATNYLFALRELGLDSDARVARILARRGPSGVLEEVSLIRSDHVKCDYLNHLLDHSTLNSRELERVTDNVRKISSDNDKADFLIAHQQDLAVNNVRNSYFSAVNSINSDNDRRRVLLHLLESNPHDAETARLVALSAKSMNSDNDKAEVLLAIPSAASSDDRCGLLNAARTIQSDNDKARVLRDASYVESPTCMDAWFAVANLINSDNDRSDVLQNLLKGTNLQADTYREIANSAKAMNSDNDKANVLSALAVRYSDKPLFDAVNSIHSDNDHARVLKAVMDQKPDKAARILVIDSATEISSDNDKADVLLEVAKQTTEPEVRSALQKACEKIGSDNDYRRVATAIFNGRESGESSK